MWPECESFISLLSALLEGTPTASLDLIAQEAVAILGSHGAACCRMLMPEKAEVRCKESGSFMTTLSHYIKPAEIYCASGREVSQYFSV